MSSLTVAADMKRLDLLNLERTIRALEVQGVSELHFDVADGHFVPRFGFSPDLIAAVKAITALPCHAHVLVSEPDKRLSEILASGVDAVTLHVETCTHIHRALGQIRDQGKAAGLAVLPATSLTKANYLFSQIDRFVLLGTDPMGRAAGMSRAALERVRLLSENIRYHEYAVSLEVEGALPVEEAARCVRFGAVRLVVGPEEVPQLGDPAIPGALQAYTEQVTAAVHTV